MKPDLFCPGQRQNNNSVPGAVIVTVSIVQIGTSMSIELTDGPVEMTILAKENASMKRLRNLMFFASLLLSMLDIPGTPEGEIAP